MTSPLPFSLKRGNRFAMQVLVTESEYYISVDGRHFASFRHRLPYGKVTCLQVVGDVTDVQVEQMNVLEYPDKLVSADEKGIVKTMEYVSDDNVYCEDITTNGNLDYLVSYIVFFFLMNCLFIYLLLPDII